MPDDERDKTVFRGAGLRINGIRLPWPVVAFVCAVIGNAFVMQYQVSRLDRTVDSMSNYSERISVLDSQVSNLRDRMNRHAMGHR